MRRIVRVFVPLVAFALLITSEVSAQRGNAYGFTSITVGDGSANSMQDTFPGADGFPLTADDHALPAMGNASGSFSSFWIDVDGDGTYAPETTNPGDDAFNNPTFDPNGTWGQAVIDAGCACAGGTGPEPGLCAPLDDIPVVGDQPWVWYPSAARNNAAFAALSRPSLGMVAEANLDVNFVHAFNNGQATHADPAAVMDMEHQESSPFWGPWGNGAGGNEAINYYQYNNDRANQRGMGKSKYWFGEIYQDEDDLEDPFNMYGPPKETQNQRKTLTLDEPTGTINHVNFRQRVDDPRTAGFNEDGRGFGTNGPCPGGLNCSREMWTAHDDMETQGLIIPIDDIAGLQSGSLDPLLGTLEGDMADYVRDTLGPVVQEVAAGAAGATLVGVSGNCATFDNTGVPTHLVIMQRQSPIILDKHQKASRFLRQEWACLAQTNRMGVQTNGADADWSCSSAAPKAGLTCRGAHTFQTDFIPVPDQANVNEFGCRSCSNRLTDATLNFTYVALMVSKNGVDRPTVPPSELRNWEQSPADGVARNLYGHEQWTRRARNNSMFQRMGVNYRNADGQRSRLIMHDQHGGSFDDVLVDNLEGEGLAQPQDDSNMFNGNKNGPGWNNNFLYSDEGVTESPFTIENEAPLDANWVARYGCPGDSRPSRDGVLVLNGVGSGHFTLPMDPSALDTGAGAVSMLLEIGAYPCENQSALYAPATFVGPGDPGNVGLLVDAAAGDTGVFCYTDGRNPVPIGGDGIDDTTVQIVFIAPPASTDEAFPGVAGGHSIDDAVVAYAEVSTAGSEIFAGGTLNADGSASDGASIAVGPGVTAWGDAGFGDGEYTRLVFRVSRISSSITEALGGSYTPFEYEDMDSYNVLATGPGVDSEVGRAGYYSSGSQGTDKVGLDSFMILHNLDEDPGDFLTPGDINGDGSANIADPINSLNFLFGGAVLDPCLVDGTTPTANLLAIADWNDDGGINIADAIGELNWLFASAAPHPNGVACQNLGDGTCGDTCSP